MEILLVEDNPADVRLAIEAFNDFPVKNHLTVAADGIEALALLHSSHPEKAAGPFDLVILDLNLPRKNGREVLAELKADPNLRRTPVVILTTSRAEQDILDCYALHANCYVNKPLEFDQFTHAIQMIQEFWLSVVTLPGGMGNGCNFIQNAAH